MSVVALIGDCTTTTAVALASGWPDDADPVIVEADRSGGSLTAWLDTPSTPSLSTVVASWREHVDRPWTPSDAMVHRSPSGVSFVAAPVLSREANRAVDEAELSVFPSMAAQHGVTIIADLGRPRPGDGLPVLARMADVVMVCHRQRAASAAAASVRLERLAELVDSVGTTPATVVVALIGDEPFGRDEVAVHLGVDGGSAVAPAHRTGGVGGGAVTVLPVDELSAAVLAGRTGVSARRWQRLPLARHARQLAADIATLLEPGVIAAHGGGS